MQNSVNYSGAPNAGIQQGTSITFVFARMIYESPRF